MLFLVGCSSVVRQYPHQWHHVPLLRALLRAVRLVEPDGCPELDVAWRAVPQELHPLTVLTPAAGGAVMLHAGEACAWHTGGEAGLRTNLTTYDTFRRDHFRASRGGPERGRALGRALARPSASPIVGPPRRARKCENLKRKVHFTGRVPFAQHLKPFTFDYVCCF